MPITPNEVAQAISMLRLGNRLTYRDRKAINHYVQLLEDDLLLLAGLAGGRLHGLRFRRAAHLRDHLLRTGDYPDYALNDGEQPGRSNKL